MKPQYLFRKFQYFQVSTQKKIIQGIWNQIWKDKIQTQITHYSFISGLKNGSLDQRKFGYFKVQDCFYLMESIKLWDKASQDSPSNRSFQDFCRKFSNTERKHKQKLEQGLVYDGFQPIRQIKQYSKYKKLLYEKNSPHYISLINYTCYKLYGSMSQKIINEEDTTANPYRKWIYANASDRHISLLQSNINTYIHLFNPKKVKNDIVSCLKLQFQIFSALDEAPSLDQYQQQKQQLINVQHRS